MPSKYGGFRTYVEPLVPFERVSGRPAEVSPSLVACENVGVVSREHLARNRPVDDLLDLLRSGPDVSQVDRPPVGVVAHGSVVRSRSMVPASAYATTSGGEAR